MKIEIGSCSGLPAVAAAVVGRLAERRVVAFHGAMGAGKTTLIREIASVLGVRDEVTSPTFAIVNHYITLSGDPLYHFDFYRVEGVAEALDIGADEYFDSGAVCLVEWPENVSGLIPPDALNVYITASDPSNPDSREIIIE